MTQIDFFQFLFVGTLTPAHLPVNFTFPENFSIFPFTGNATVVFVVVVVGIPILAWLYHYLYQGSAIGGPWKGNNWIAKNILLKLVFCT